MTRQFWLTLHVPKEQAAGTYAGQVKVTSEGKEVGSIPFQVRILPLAMERGKFNFSMMYLSELGVSEQGDRWYEADLKDLAEHGFNSVFIRDKATESGRPLGRAWTTISPISAGPWSCARNTA